MASQVCNQCSNINPGDASYCYFDGVRLAGGAGGPVNAGTQNFPTSFVFPSGLICRNFDQFATTCQQNWEAAVALLKDGMFASFFGGMGRTDLAMAAKEAARFPDLDRGFDQFLAKLPTNTLQDPKLKAEPTEINLGQMSIGTDRTLELRLENVGMRLLYGSVSSDCKWLSLGELPGNQQKLFQFGTETVIPLHVRGQRLRASPKPLEGQLLIESNGGKPATVTVRVTVPIIPFKEGVLAGSKSPREIAEKARSKAAEAAKFFENGAIADWFKRNGWIYPVQGPAAVGLGGVQQFFEALGLAKAPKVEISAKSLSLSGDPGQSTAAEIAVTTQEKKMVYAHATCEQPWVDVSKVKLNGRTATITVAVPTIPDRPGETLQTKIHIAGNGNQRFSLPLSIAISGTPVARPSPPPPPPAPPPPPSDNPFAFTDSPAAPIVKTSPRESREPREPKEKEIQVAKPPRKKNGLLIHMIPLGVLALGLLVFMIRDIFSKVPPAPGGDTEVQDPIEPRPKILVCFDYGEELAGDNVDIEYRKPPFRNMNFGLTTYGDVTIVDESKRKKDEKSKKLLFAVRGKTNNTLMRIDDKDSTFGLPNTGDWEIEPKFTPWEKSKIAKWLPKEGICTWKKNGILITQDVRIIPGESVEVNKDDFKRFYDTCEVTYRIKNVSGASRNFGMRIMLDTYIGANDGVPFTIPGKNKLIYMEKFTPASKVPDFIMAYENEDLKDPGVVVQLNLRHTMKDRNLEPPDELRLTKWPGDPTNLAKTIDSWEVPLADPKEAKDSAVVMYWNVKKLADGHTRDLGYTYGLASTAPSSGGRLSMSLGGDKKVGGEVSVIAVVSNAKKGEKVVLELPKGFDVVEGELEQLVPEPQEGRPKPITWRLKANVAGNHIIRAHTVIDSASQGKRIAIRHDRIL